MEVARVALRVTVEFVALLALVASWVMITALWLGFFGGMAYATYRFFTWLIAVL